MSILDRLTSIRAKSLADVNRWIDQAVSKLQPVLQYGTQRFQGYPIATPADANAGETYVWNPVTKAFEFAALSTSGATGGPIGSSTVVPVITVVNGLVTVLGSATITGIAPSGPAGGALAGTYPNPTLASVIAAGGPIGSSTTVPVISWNAAGQLTVVGTASISGTVPSGTSQGQFLVWNGSSWALVQYPNYIDLPPVTASSLDDEFDSPSLAGAWSTDTGVSAGTVDFANTVSSAVPAGTELYDLTSEPGSLLLQNCTDGTSRGVFKNVAAYYNANSTVLVVCRVTMGFSSNSYTSNDSWFEFFITDGASKTNWVGITLQPDSGDYVARFGSQSNTNRGQIKLNPQSGQAYTAGPIYLAILRQSTVYKPFLRVGQSRWMYFGSNAGAIPTTNSMIPGYVYMRAKNAATPNSVAGIDWFRVNNSGVLPTGG